MKTIKTIAASALALGFAGGLGAQTDIRVAGSTAFRTAVVRAEIAILSNVNDTTGGGGGTGTPVEINATAGKNVTNDNYSAVHGFDASGNEIIFRNSWTGSVAGVVDLAQGNNDLFIPLTDAKLAIVPGGVQFIGQSAGAANDAELPMVAMSDNQLADAVAATKTANTSASTAILAAIATNGPVDATTAPSGVAVVTFQWALGKLAAGAPIPTNWAPVGSTNINPQGGLGYNITQDQAAVLINNGNVPLSVITGNPADATSVVFYVGRNEDSGSRILYQAESLSAGTTGNIKAFGAGTTQWMLNQGIGYPTGPAPSPAVDAVTLTTPYPSISVQAGPISAFQRWPQKQNTVQPAAPGTTGWEVATIPALTWNLVGHSGYNGGGDVAAVLSTPNPVNTLAVPTGAPPFTNAYFVSCLGTSDAATVIGNSGVGLAYNGVPYSVANIQNGSYALWNFEHLYYLTGAQANSIVTNPTAQTGANELATFLLTSPDLGTAGIDIGTVVATRASQAAGAQIR